MEKKIKTRARFEIHVRDLRDAKAKSEVYLKTNSESDARDSLYKLMNGGGGLFAQYNDVWIKDLLLDK